jgi:hypothetical protein
MPQTEKIRKRCLKTVEMLGTLKMSYYVRELKLNCSSKLFVQSQLMAFPVLVFQN